MHALASETTTGDSQEFSIVGESSKNPYHQQQQHNNHHHPPQLQQQQHSTRSGMMVDVTVSHSIPDPLRAMHGDGSAGFALSVPPLSAGLVVTSAANGGVALAPHSPPYENDPKNITHSLDLRHYQQQQQQQQQQQEAPKSWTRPPTSPNKNAAIAPKTADPTNVPRVVSAPEQCEKSPKAGTRLDMAPIATGIPANSSSSPSSEGNGNSKKANGSATGNENTVQRRQKRLERNRESARLSRRRRKQYLEVLEENVNRLSQEVDQGRRDHVKQAIMVVANQRAAIIAATASLTSGCESIGNNALATAESQWVLLETALARTNKEMMIVNTFQWQQLKSFLSPPSTSFILWLTLQNDDFFRGGRASSERLSAARIGERMLSSGLDQVTPSQAMWPLFCNEVGLSYEQEEKVRSSQKAILQNPETWLHRHAAFAGHQTLRTLHDATQSVTARLGQRERLSSSFLSIEQRMKLATWATRNRDLLRARTASSQRVERDPRYAVSHNQHPAANLYTVNHRLQAMWYHIPRAVPLVSGPGLKKLSQRPLFESLGCVALSDSCDNMSRENSSGSLKRSVSEMSVGDSDERLHVQSINPEEAQSAAAPLIEKVLGHLKEIIPEPPKTYLSLGPTNVIIPEPTPVSSFCALTPVTAAPSPCHVMASPQCYMPTTSMTHPGLSHPLMYTSTGGNHYLNNGNNNSNMNSANQMMMMMMPVPDPYVEAPEAKHARKSSFLPPHLNVVPEEMWTGEPDEILMNLVDGDWAIGEGIDMDVIS